jgi:hypothetical protein
MRAAAPFIALVLGIAPAFGQEPRETTSKDWTLVRSVRNGQGSTIEFVVVPERRRADLAMIAACVRQEH